MKNDIENKLNKLLGKKLTSTTRSVDMECLKFGFKNNDKNQNIGEFAIHIQADWRIINKKSILVGSRDLYEPNSKNISDNSFVHYESGNLRDEKLETLIKKNEFKVSKITSDDFGGLNITFENQAELQIIPVLTVESEYNEFWRFIENKDANSEHFVVGINGIED